MDIIQNIFGTVKILNIQCKTRISWNGPGQITCDAVNLIKTFWNLIFSSRPVETLTLFYTGLVLVSIT